MFVADDLLDDSAWDRLLRRGPFRQNVTSDIVGVVRVSAHPGPRNPVGLGELIEYNATEVVFQNPANPRTEDYITGRFG